MLSLLHFRHLYLLPVAGTLIFYAIPSMLGLLLRNNGYDAKMLTLSLIAMTAYLLAFHLLWSPAAIDAWIRRIRWLRVRVSWQHFCLVVLILYFGMIAYAAATAPGIALVASFQGASIDQIAQLRETFLRTRTGAERALLYWYAINILSLIPLILSILFLKQTKYRYHVLVAFLFTLALTLEKSLSVTALIPLMVMFYNSNRKKLVYLIGIALIVAITVVSFAARGGLSKEEDEPAPATAAPVPDGYNLFQGTDSQAIYVVNRILYIPYASAVDWLRYLDIELGAKPVGGQSVGIIAYLTGRPRLNLEREIFTFQWGQNETATGSANTVFYIDAYLNFGVVGILAYAALLALLARLCLASKNRALCAGLAVPMIYVCFNSLPAIIFSGGLGILGTLAVLARFDDSTLEWKRNDQFMFSRISR